MPNKYYAELVDFDKDKLSYSIHKRLRLYVASRGKHLLQYYIAKLSHEIFATRNAHGHAVRQRIREGLRGYADGYYESLKARKCRK